MNVTEAPCTADPPPPPPFKAKEAVKAYDALVALLAIFAFEEDIANDAVAGTLLA